MAAGEVRPDIVIYGNKTDSRSISLAQELEAELEPIRKAPATWHLETVRGRLELVGRQGLRFALNESDIERRLVGFSHSGLAKACGASRMPRILDALSGWGTDGLTLSAFGCRVACCEVVPLIATLSRARALIVAPQIRIFCCDAVDFMKRGRHEFDVIYLDDMFPQHPKGARPSKSLQILAALAGSCDFEEVFDTALNISKDRVVVKRRRNQPPERTDPAWSVDGKTVRFDVYRASSI
ncbi:MAG: class I SAM-dependent methyltransferase [Gammaproteobacteria bacterium]|nr:class I SAM-dependent methyltransferase [Gammaproteobacteria bacterium]